MSSKHMGETRVCARAGGRKRGCARPDCEKGWQPSVDLPGSMRGWGHVRTGNCGAAGGLCRAEWQPAQSQSVVCAAGAHGSLHAHGSDAG